MRTLRGLVPLLIALVVASAAPSIADVEPHGVWPLRPQPEVVRGFDPPEVTWGSGHRGVDLRGSIGQTVRSALAGRVSFVGTIAGVPVVVVDHGGTRTTYQPVAASVRVGDEVGAGGVIGTLGWFGSHCLPAACLHWGLVEGDRYLDPLTIVGGPRPVRLLPVDGAGPVVRQVPVGQTPALSGWHGMRIPLLVLP
jgi:murein DD-endopeptidase MepM/ murein hydrolase activator NlpD